MKPSINVIVAFDLGRGISKDGAIPWKIKEDMKVFTYMTTHVASLENTNIVIMGKNTWSSLNKKPLPKRINIIVSTSMVQKDIEEYENTYVVNTIEDSLTLAQSLNHFDKHNIENIYIIGGKHIYNKFFESYEIDNFYVTIIGHNYECDNCINQLSNQNIMHTYTGKYIVFDEAMNKHVGIQFNHYVNKKLEFDYDTTYQKYIVDMFDFINDEEHKYLGIMTNIINKGHFRPTRNGNTHTLFGKKLKFELNHFPLLTTKKMFLRGIFEELKFFLLGQTNTKILEEKGVNIWKGNTSEEFLKQVKLPYLEGDMGPMYGFQLRHFNATYHGSAHNYFGKGVDQFKNVIHKLKTNRFDRRILMTTYNPEQVELGVLAPCHGISIQFVVEDDNKLCCMMVQRSADWFLGVPFNIASYAILNYIVCDIVNNEMDDEQLLKYGKLVAGTLIINFGDVHIYQEHLDVVKEQLEREPYKFPKLHIKKSDLTLETLNTLEFTDLVLSGYECYPALKAKMIA
jgi:dihydrofolate reductase/thymidylate synthase